MPTDGERLFARYAHAPNALGYCGPAVGAALQRVACGAGSDVDVAKLARQFSGAWPYQALMGELTGLDPLSVEIGRAYWTGSPLTDEIDSEALGRLLLDRFGRQAGHYWAHLTDDLLAEVTPTHAFHVLGVYPWSRLLTTGLPEPLHVLDSCRIRAGQVVDVGDDDCAVEIDTLLWTGGALAASAPRRETVQRSTPDGTFTPNLCVGDWVAVHWGFACDRLTGGEAEQLLVHTVHQLDLTNHRLSGA